MKICEPVNLQAQVLRDELSESNINYKTAATQGLTESNLALISLIIIIILEIIFIV